jgi:hypothetical protein
MICNQEPQPAGNLHICREPKLVMTDRAPAEALAAPSTFTALGIPLTHFLPLTVLAAMAASLIGTPASAYPHAMTDTSVSFLWPWATCHLRWEFLSSYYYPLRVNTLLGFFFGGGLPNFAVRSFHFISANSLRLIKVSKI